MTLKDASPAIIAEVFIVVLCTIIGLTQPLAFLVGAGASVFLIPWAYLFYKEPTWEEVYKEVSEEQEKAQREFEEHIRKIVREEMSREVNE